MNPSNPRFFLILLQGLLLLSFFSCKKKVPDHGEYFVFGILSEGGADPTNLFLLENGKLYRDDIKYELDKLKFRRSKLSEYKAEAAKKLKNHLPQFFKDAESQDVGCTGCDGPVYILKFTIEGGRKDFRVDGDTTVIPKEIRSYIGEMRTLILSL